MSVPGLAPDDDDDGIDLGLSFIDFEKMLI